MPVKTEVPISEPDYKSAVKGEKVSIKQLIMKMDAVEVSITVSNKLMCDLKLELNGIIEEIGEEW